MNPLDPLPHERRAVIAELVDALRAVPGVAAIGLGGSWARGTAHPDSDVDLALYYREAAPIDLVGLRSAAARVDPQVAPTPPFAWGPWVNGGAWLHTAAGRVDLIYRSVEHVRRVLEEAAAGRVAWDFHQQPPFGFHNVIYFAETADCLPLSDADGILPPLKELVRVYPEALRRAILATHLWGAEFSLYHASAAARRGDVYGATGGFARVAAHLTQAMFALNRVYFATDKGALEAIDAMALRPDGYASAIRAVLAAPGADRDALSTSADAVAALIASVIALAGDDYHRPFTLR